MKRPARILTDIARAHLGIPTLKTRRSDRHDFYDLAVWQIKSALKAAFEAGAETKVFPSTAGAALATPFDGYEIHGIKEFGKGKRRYCEQVPDSQAEFWSLFGHIPGQGLDCIGDFATREHAEEIFARITGKPYSP
jgi:hypothetical protein